MAFIEGHNLVGQFGKFRDLQYRPLAFVLGRLLEIVFGVSPISLRLGSFLVHIVNCWLLFCFINRLIKNRLYAFLAALIFAVHYGLYFIFSLYLVAAMPGLGVTTFLLTLACFQNSLLAKHKNSRSYRMWQILGVLCQCMGLLIYEGTLPVVACLAPLIFLNMDTTIVRTRQWKKVWDEVLPIVPYLSVAIFYLTVRLPLIKHAFATNPVDTSWYQPDIGKVLINLTILGRTALGYPHYFNFQLNSFHIFLTVVSVILAFTAWKNTRVFFLGSVICVAGVAPFLVLPEMQDYYAIFAILGLCVLFAAFLQTLHRLVKLRLLLSLAIGTFVGVVVAKSIDIVNRGYETHALTRMANWSLSFNRQFFALARQYPPGARIEVRGISMWQQWRIHFGDNININLPFATPYQFTFITPEEVENAKSRGGSCTHVPGAVVLAIVNLDPDEEKGLFKLVEVIGSNSKKSRL